MRLGQHVLDQDLYAVLGVSPAATREQIRRAHRRLCFRYHPDLNPTHQAAAEERMKAVNVAATVLLDPAARAVYDCHRAAVRSTWDASEAATQPRATRPAPPRSPHPPPPRQDSPPRWETPPRPEPQPSWTPPPTWEPAEPAFEAGLEPERPWWLFVPLVFFLALGLLAALGSGPPRQSGLRPFRMEAPLWTPPSAPLWSPPSTPLWSPPSFDPPVPDLSWREEERRIRRENATLDRLLRRMRRAEQAWRETALPSWSDGLDALPGQRPTGPGTTEWPIGRWAGSGTAADPPATPPAKPQVPQIVDAEDPPPSQR